MREILIEHSRRYPLWELDDAYKLIHQAAIGSEHAVGDEARARAWLVRELARLGPGPDEPLIDPISPDGAIVRVHLRPYARLGLESEQLLQAFLRTAREFRGSPGEVQRGLMSAARLAREERLAFREADVLAFVARMEAGGFPTMHHSAAFGAEYRPAYRVVARPFLPKRLSFPA